MSRLRGILFLAALLWFIGAFGYHAATSSKVRKECATKYSKGILVDKVRFTDHYLQSSKRSAEVHISYDVQEVIPGKTRGLVREERVLQVETEGRWWPTVVTSTSEGVALREKNNAFETAPKQAPKR